VSSQHAGNVARRVGPREPPGIRAHFGQARRGVEEPVDLPRRHREVVAPDRYPGFEEVVGVPLLLAGDRADDLQGELAGQSLGARKATGLPSRRFDAAMNSSISVV
jgi:hypothetical protein